MNQPEYIMRDFDIIDQRIALFKRRKSDDAERENALNNLRGRAHG